MCFKPTCFIVVPYMFKMIFIVEENVATFNDFHSQNDFFAGLGGRLSVCPRSTRKTA